MSGELLREAVEWVVTALAGRASPEERAARLAPRLAGRGDVGGYSWLAAFREHPAVVEDLRARGDWVARAILTTGPARWELDVTVEPEPPHRILSFQLRPVVADAVVLPAGPRAADHRWSALSEVVAAGIDRRLAAVADEQSLVGMVVDIAVGGEVVYRGCFGVADLGSRAVGWPGAARDRPAALGRRHDLDRRRPAETDRSVHRGGEPPTGFAPGIAILDGRDESGGDESGGDESGGDENGRDENGRDENGRDENGRGRARLEVAARGLRDVARELCETTAGRAG
jgi:hypothetical protein